MTQLKQQAITNYQVSLAQYGGCLRNPIAQLLRPQPRNTPYEIDVAVIGTGYGGGITAARLAQQKRAGVRLCVFERGQEWIPGSFPDRFRDALRQNRFGLRGAKRGQLIRPTGLVNFQKSDEVDILTGSGLGGTSLINANVAVKADPEVFQQSRWPKALRYAEVLDPFYDAAAFELGVTTGPIDSSPKMVAMRRAAARMATHDKAHWAANLAVTFDSRFQDAHGRNPQGMLQNPCNMCGDCMSGCNVGAKNTVQMNYLPLAKAHGAEIYTEITCRYVEKCAGYYRLHLTCYQDQGGVVQAVPFTKTARVVVMAGGSMGSTEMLLHSRNRGLALSPALGCNWSGNGDVLGFITKTDSFANSAGMGAYGLTKPPVGPAIQSITRLYGNAPLPHRILIEDGNMPRAYANVLGLLMRDRDLEHTMVVFGMGHDGTRGQIVLKNGNGAVHWPNAKNSRYRSFMRQQFEMVAAAHGGKYRFLRAFGAESHHRASAGRVRDVRRSALRRRQ